MLLLLLSILLIPFVSAATDDVLDILIGSSESSMVFLRFMYGALIFIIFLSVVKKTIFKADASDKQSKKLGNIFSLIIAIFATRFTPESVVQNFGWVIMFLTPLLIYYTIFGIFTRAKVQKADDKELNFSWTRFILALIATLFTLSALGKNNYLGNFPFIGGGLNELFFDLNYYLFDKWLPFLLILILLGIILALLSKFGGFGTKKDADGKEIPSLIPGWIILALLLLLIILGLAALFGGIGLGWLKPLLIVLGALALLFILIRFFPFLRGLFSRRPGSAGTPVPSDRIRIDLTANGRSVNSNPPITRALLTEPSTPMNISVKVSVRSRFWFNQPVQNANLTYSITTGSITGSPRTDAAGSASSVYNPPSNDATAYLTINVASTPTSAAYTSPRFPIEIRSKNKLSVSISPSNIIVDIGNTATINVNVLDSKGKAVPNANVIVDFDKASIPTITRLTNTTGLATAITPILSTARTHNFTATITHPNFRKPVKVSGTITVRNPTTPDLEVRITNPSNLLTTPANIILGNSLTIEFFISEKGATPTVPINTASFKVSPNIGIPNFRPVKRNTKYNGTYNLIITPDRTQAGKTEKYTLTVSNKGYNDLTFDFDIIIPALPQLIITPSFPNSVFEKNISSLQVSITDSTATNVNATLKVNYTVGGSAPSTLNFTRNSSGIYTSNFTPTNPGNYNFNITATHPKFADTTVNTNIQVNPLPLLSLACVLLWAPNPSNYYQLMQIKVINNNTGTPVKGAKVSIADSHANQLNITGQSVTDATGSFPSQIRLQPATTISTSEIHNINITVSASGFPIASTSIQMTFEPPGSPLGGISRVVF